MVDPCPDKRYFSARMTILEMSSGILMTHFSSHQQYLEQTYTCGPTAKATFQLQDFWMQLLVFLAVLTFRYFCQLKV